MRRRIARRLALPAAIIAIGAIARAAAGELPGEIAPFFRPPPELASNLGDYRSPLRFDDGREAKSAAEWRERRKEILAYWHGVLGAWPPLIDKPQVIVSGEERLGGLTRRKVAVEAAPGGRQVPGYLLVPDGRGPFPAVLVVYYDPETGAGLGKELRDFGLQLTRRGFVALSIGWQPLEIRSGEEHGGLQPLSFLAYVAANCHTALARRPEVDPGRIGITGHSYGGKWAMFASCLHEKFACAAWSDGGVVFDESRSNVNFWEPWYLGWESGVTRKRGIPTAENPRTGAYRRLIEAKRDLHELHALMAPRPFLVSGGSEDPPERWRALNHAIRVNRLLGREDRVALTSRKGHDPTPESNEQMYIFFEHFLKPRGEQ